MNALQTLQAQAALVPADFSITSLLENSTEMGKAIGGGIITLIGLVAVVFGVVKGIMKLFSEKEQMSWVKIIASILIGGAFMAGGITLAMSLAEGGKTTIEELGGGIIVLSSFLG